MRIIQSVMTLRKNMLPAYLMLPFINIVIKSYIISSIEPDVA